MNKETKEILSDLDDSLQELKSLSVVEIKPFIEAKKIRQDLAVLVQEGSNAPSEGRE